MNVEGLYSSISIKMTKQSETILRNLSAFEGFDVQSVHSSSQAEFHISAALRPRASSLIGEETL